jgi:hypothetical protein
MTFGEFAERHNMLFFYISLVAMFFLGYLFHLNLSPTPVLCSGDPNEFYVNGSLQYAGRAFIDRGYFVVWAKDRSWNSVLDVCRHEYAHIVDYTVHPEDLRGLENGRTP